MPINTERLLQLAEFLETKMPKAKWNFRTILTTHGKSPSEAFDAGDVECGTVGCAIGWTPAIFPDLVQWVRTLEAMSEHTHDAWTVVPRREGFDNFNYDTIAKVAEHLFGLHPIEADFLFMPGETRWADGPECYIKIGEERLDEKATPQEVAAHIRKFVANLPQETVHATVD